MDEILCCHHSNKTSSAELSNDSMSVDEILWYDHSNETSSAELSNDSISVDEILWYDHSNETSSIVPQVLSLMLFKEFSVLTFEVVDEILS